MEHTWRIWILKVNFRHSYDGTFRSSWTPWNWLLAWQLQRLIVDLTHSNWSPLKTGKCDQETSFRPWRRKIRQPDKVSFAARLACLKNYSNLQQDIEYMQIVVVSEPHGLGGSDFTSLKDSTMTGGWMDIPTYCCPFRLQNYFCRTMPNVSTFPSLVTSSELTIVAWDPQPKSLNWVNNSCG